MITPKQEELIKIAAKKVTSNVLEQKFFEEGAYWSIINQKKL